MTSSLMLADHEGLYEGWRMTRAVAVGSAIAVLAGFVYWRIRPAHGRPWETMAGRFALAGVLVAAVTVGLGLKPRETAHGYVICGPPLNVPNSIPAFSDAAWADSEHCNAVMQAPMWWLAIGILGSAGFFVAARIARPRMPD